MVKMIFMRKFFLLFAALLLLTVANAQTTISGFIKDKGHAIPGASITLKDTYDGATTDSTGFFKFETTEQGARTITITAVNYKPVEQDITIGKEAVTINLSLKEQIDELRAVMVTAGSF